MMPSVNDPRHVDLVSRVTEFCESIGCVVSGFGVEMLDQCVREVLRRTGNYDATSQYVRSRKDLFATKGSRTLLLDPKTSSWQFSRGDDFTIELAPLFYAANNASCGVNTLFCCRYSDGHEFGFFPSLGNLASLVHEIRFPDSRYPGSMGSELWSSNYSRLFGRLGLNVKFNVYSRNGSADAYALLRGTRRISSSVEECRTVAALPSWEDMISKYFEGQSS